LGWGLSSVLALHREYKPSADLPSPRLVTAELVEKDLLPDEVALPLARVRELTDPTDEVAAAPAPSVQTAEKMLASVQALIDFGRRKLAELAL
jgi:hypothetical protein